MKKQGMLVTKSESVVHVLCESLISGEFYGFVSSENHGTVGYPISDAVLTKKDSIGPDYELRLYVGLEKTLPDGSTVYFGVDKSFYASDGFTKKTKSFMFCTKGIFTRPFIRRVESLARPCDIEFFFHNVPNYDLSPLSAWELSFLQGYLTSLVMTVLNNYSDSDSDSDE
jgi:hypothetical protein